MAPEVLLGFTIRIMYSNKLFSYIYNLNLTKIQTADSASLFVYLLLTAVTRLQQSQLNIGEQ